VGVKSAGGCDCEWHGAKVLRLLSQGRFLGRNPDNSLKSPCYSQAPLQLFFFFKLMAPLTVSTVQLLYSVKEKGGKPDRKPYHIPYDLRNPSRKLKSENSQDYAQTPQRNCVFTNSAISYVQEYTLLQPPSYREAVTVQNKEFY